jgi:hypothetical protein
MRGIILAGRRVLKQFLFIFQELLDFGHLTQRKILPDIRLTAPRASRQVDGEGISQIRYADLPHFQRQAAFHAHQSHLFGVMLLRGHCLPPSSISILWLYAL